MGDWMGDMTTTTRAPAVLKTRLQWEVAPSFHMRGRRQMTGDLCGPRPKVEGHPWLLKITLPQRQDQDHHHRLFHNELLFKRKYLGKPYRFIRQRQNNDWLSWFVDCRLIEKGYHQISGKRLYVEDIISVQVQIGLGRVGLHGRSPPGVIS